MKNRGQDRVEINRETGEGVLRGRFGPVSEVCSQQTFRQTRASIGLWRGGDSN